MALTEVSEEKYLELRQEFGNSCFYIEERRFQRKAGTQSVTYFENTKEQKPWFREFRGQFGGPLIKTLVDLDITARAEQARIEYQAEQKRINH